MRVKRTDATPAMNLLEVARQCLASREPWAEIYQRLSMELSEADMRAVCRYMWTLHDAQSRGSTS